MSDRITYCDVVECCAECPRYGDDCDGDKRNDDLISRADAIEAVCGVVIDEFDVSPTRGYEVAEKALSALPSAEPSLKAIKRQIDEHWYLDPPSAEAVQGWIPCSEGLPEEHEWVGTKPFGTTISDKVHITFDVNGDRFVRTLSLQNGELSNYEKRTMDTLYKGWKMMAWMPLPKPYKGGDSEWL